MLRVIGMNRRNSRGLLASGAAGLALLAATSAHAAASPCAQLAQTKLADMEVNAASEVAGLLPETALAPSLKPGNPHLQDLPRFCRVIATLTPAANSNIRFEIWLPEQWNGKLLGIGNHGMAGELEHDDMAMGLRRGYAVAMSDMGVGAAGPKANAAPVSNARQVAENPDAADDFAWRATHQMTVVAKAMVQAHYGSAPRLSYFDACSSGGRQAMREAQQFPHDYDGIIAGSARAYSTRAMSASLWLYTELSRAGLTPAKLTLARNAAVAACDRQDGLADNLIADPRQCHWKPSALVCKAGADPATCLTADEAAAIARLEGPMIDPATGKAVYVGWYPGGEAQWAPDGRLVLAQSVSVYFRDLIARDPKWTAANADVFKLLEMSEQPGSPGLKINTTNPDMSAFRARGGKLIQFHGWNDEAYPPRWYPDYYGQVVDLQPGADKLAAAQDFYRLFMVPGMGHCRGGEGPVNFGGLSHPPSPTVDADHDILEALDRWVDKRVPPDRLIATQFAEGTRPQRQMPLCPYPASAVYVSGDPNRAESFACRNPGNVKN